MLTLTSNFRTALNAIEIDERLRDYAAEAHAEIRGHLESDPVLCGWGIDTVVIGSYARHTGIHPGKDVDVFTKLTRLSIDTIAPAQIYESVRDVLCAKYGDERVEPQPRSVKVSFDRPGYEFSVDVVPAVRLGDRWGIPRRDRDTWAAREASTRWVETDPERLTQLTQQRNREPLVDGRGAYVPTVKLVRQIRRHHRGDHKPGGFYFELMTYWAFEQGHVSGTTFAEILATTLDSIGRQLSAATPVIDPVLGRLYQPSPDPQEVSAAASVFTALARQATQALTDEKCPAAAAWRRIIGQNEKVGWCFPLPEGCDADGRALPVVAPGHRRPSREPGGFA
ncbi:MAG TPA: hypothetical protein VFT50_11780 [Baekduia sp.]|nr:hypothetical protein [Baekduia sp.]